jgi:hypothetical protein
MGADGIDHRGLLADEQVTGTVQSQAALLLWRLGRNEPHVRPVTASQIASASVASFLWRSNGDILPLAKVSKKWL